MRSNTVAELPRPLEPVSKDTFLDGSGDSKPNGRVSPRYRAPQPPKAGVAAPRHQQPQGDADLGEMGQRRSRKLRGPMSASLPPSSSSRKRLFELMAGAVQVRDTSAWSEQIDKVHGALVRHSIMALRVAVGAVFLGFGVMKFFPGVSPAQDLAIKTIDLLTFGLVSGQAGLVAIATLECLIGICLLANRCMRFATCLLALQLVGILAPIVLLTGRLFSGPHHAPTLEGQYVLKDIILAAAGMVIAATTFRGGRLVRDEPQPARASSTQSPEPF